LIELTEKRARSDPQMTERQSSPQCSSFVLRAQFAIRQNRIASVVAVDAALLVHDEDGSRCDSCLSLCFEDFFQVAQIDAGILGELRRRERAILSKRDATPC
jgi:hypothetical protein